MPMAKIVFAIDMDEYRFEADPRFTGYLCHGWSGHTKSIWNPWGNVYHAFDAICIYTP